LGVPAEGDREFIAEQLTLQSPRHHVRLDRLPAAVFASYYFETPWSDPQLRGLLSDPAPVDGDVRDEEEEDDDPEENFEGTDVDGPEARRAARSQDVALTRLRSLLDMDDDRAALT
jgi:hypothetical protein